MRNRTKLPDSRMKSIYGFIVAAKDCLYASHSGIPREQVNFTVQPTAKVTDENITPDSGCLAGLLFRISRCSGRRFCSAQADEVNKMYKPKNKVLRKRFISTAHPHGID